MADIYVKHAPAKDVVAPLYENADRERAGGIVGETLELTFAFQRQCVEISTPQEWASTSRSKARRIRSAWWGRDVCRTACRSVAYRGGVVAGRG